MLHIYNTLTKRKEIFKPTTGEEVKIYHCGPTVYDYAHIGNLRPYVFADVLRRTLEWGGFEVEQVINITDVGHLVGDDEDTGEDKMMKALRREGKEATLENMKAVALKYEEAFLEDMGALGILAPHYLPRASEHISEDVELIQKLEEKDLIYRTSDGLYFDTSKLSDYGKLGGLTEAQESRIEENPEKRNFRDFALWKFSKDKEVGFASPWGMGFPGWHIECSAMSRKYLGQPFDIHTGGIDHIPVHHNNEIAQSECAYGSTLANYWMHVGHLQIEDRKISKSIGNTFTLKDIMDKGFSPSDYRYYLLGIHYRSGANFKWEALEAAKKTLQRLKLYVADEIENGEINKKYIERFKASLEDDLNTPEALASLWEAARDEKLSQRDKKATIVEMNKVLGLDLSSTPGKTSLPKEVEKLAEERTRARFEKDFKKADLLRQEMKRRGYVVKDTPEGQVILEK